MCYIACGGDDCGEDGRGAYSAERVVGVQRGDAGAAGVDCAWESAIWAMDAGGARMDVMRRTFEPLRTEFYPMEQCEF